MNKEKKERILGVDTACGRTTWETVRGWEQRSGKWEKKASIYKETNNEVKP